MKKISVVILLILGLGWWLLAKSTDDNDFRIGIISDSGITMQSISSQRRMINSIEVGGSMPVWIPGGMGWYQSNKIKKIIEQEKKQSLVTDIFLYNFGFMPDLVVYNNNWNNREMISKWGIGNFLKYYLNQSKLMIKKETTVDGEVIQRDLADGRLLREDLRLTVYNLGQSDGFGAFMSRVLEWSGFTVVNVDSMDKKINGSCQINFGPEVAESFGGKFLKKIFPMCEFLQNDSLGNTEAELYFGEEFSKMLNYDSYVRTF